MLSNTFNVDALYDLGASSCSIKRSVLHRMDAISPVPRVPYKFTIEGFVPGAIKKGDEVAMVTFKLENGYTVHRIPMLVSDDTCKYDMVIGNNVVRAHRWSNFWTDDDYFVDFGQPENKPVKAYFLSDSSFSAVSVNTFTLQPSQSITTELEIPSLYGLSKY